MPGVTIDQREPGSMMEALAGQPYAGAVILLDRPLLALWAGVRRALVQADIPTIILAPLSAETLHLLAFERELRLIGLHILGFEDSPAHLRASLKGLLTHGELQRFLRRFGAGASVLESLILPCWRSLTEVVSVESWAALLGRDPTELRAQLRRHGVRSPRRLLTWLRLLSAWPLLQAGRAAGEVALAVGYSAPPAFTRSALQFVGVPPSRAETISLERLIDCAAADLVA